MSEIIVVGAGHGGLIAAAKLAKAGHKVRVLECKREDELGYEWEDRFDFDALASALEISVDDFAEDSWCYRSDSTFVSPDKTTHIDVRFDDNNRQKIMWRKPLIALLLHYARQCGVQFVFECHVDAPIVENNAVVGVMADNQAIHAELVIDASGVMSPLRAKLPSEWGLKEPIRGDVFYAYRAYFERVDGYDTPPYPFEVYLVHEGEPGLSWLYTMPDAVDVLIGRIEPIDQSAVERHLALFRQTHPWLGTEVKCGGRFAVIPVRRPLPRFVGNGYAAVGNAAYMTTPMNGMGIDLSVAAGQLLAQTVCRYGVGIESLWQYNRQYLLSVGAQAAKNEGLKNTLLSMPVEGVNCLYRYKVIEADNLAGGATKMTFSDLLRKFANGMRCPRYFFAVIGGLIKGAKNTRFYRRCPAVYDEAVIQRWANKIERNVVPIRK